MIKDLFNNLIFPIITTAIGAAIGGYSAYRIARGQYFTDRLNEAIGSIFLLKKTADRIYEKSKRIIEYIEALEMREYIEKIDEEDTSKFTEIHLEIDTDSSQLIYQWEMFKENVSLCGSKFICKNLETRKNIEILGDKFSKLSFKLQRYIKLCKSFKKKYDDKAKKEEFELHSFLNSNDSKWQFRKADSYLKEISDLCKKISEIYENLERNMLKTKKFFSFKIV